MKIVPDLPGVACEQGYEMVEQGGIIVVGLSLGNSFYNRDSVRELLGTAKEHFRRVVAMVPDRPYKHTLMAKGHPDPGRKAEEKGRDMVRWVEQADTEVALVTWDNLRGNSTYLQQRGEIVRQYVRDEMFRRAMNDATARVVDPDGERPSSVPVGVRFLHDELGFLMASPQLLGGPVAYSYHNNWPLFENLVGGFFDAPRRKNLGFVRIE